MRRLSGFALCWGFLAARPASAETITVNCKGEEFDKPYELTLAYEGGDSGTLMVSGSFGEMSLPAAKKYRQAANDAATRSVPQ